MACWVAELNGIADSLAGKYEGNRNLRIRHNAIRTDEPTQHRVHVASVKEVQAGPDVSYLPGEASLRVEDAG